MAAKFLLVCNPALCLLQPLLEETDWSRCQPLPSSFILSPTMGLTTWCVSLSFYRYQVLNPNVIPQGFVDNKKASELLLGSTGLGEDEYKIGHTKVLFIPTNFSQTSLRLRLNLSVLAWETVLI